MLADLWHPDRLTRKVTDLLFYRLLQQAVATEPHPLQTLIDHST